jgi:hypothetical protein
MLARRRSQSATGSLFRPAENVDPQRSVVYVYFPYGTNSSNACQGFSVNGARITRLDYGGYYSFVSLPGQVTISLSHYENSEHVPNLVAGQTYFVKVRGNTGVKASSTYWFVEALEEIRKCHLMEPLKEGGECKSWKRTLPVCQFNPQW